MADTPAAAGMAEVARAFLNTDQWKFARAWSEDRELLLSTLLTQVRSEALQTVMPTFIPLDWRTMTADDCQRALYEIGGALRSMQRHALAIRVEKVANILYPGKIKPLPIIPRTTSG
jgi:hypothetical protein